ncbi:MAG: magnesium transporter [Patescibacteria group bacterium]
MEQNLNNKIAGKKSVTNVPTATLDARVADIKREIISHAVDFETINYIYILDYEKHLRGVMSLRDLFRFADEKKVAEVMVRNVVSVHSGTHQERVAILAIQHNIKAIPVVDKENHFLGVVPSDVILAILHEENVEDALRFTGIGLFADPLKSLTHASAWSHFIKRLPWLCIGLLGGIIVAVFIKNFESVLETEILLAAFIPMIVYLADAVGGQTQMIFIRSLAFSSSISLTRNLSRELIIGTLIGFLFSITIFAISLFWLRSLVIGLILSISVFFTIFIAVVVAIFLPWYFLKRGADPAIAAGPLATVIRDILSIIIYFGIASALLNIFRAV